MTTKQITLPITGMTCANCAATIERGLKKLPTVQNAAINLASERASLEFDPTQLTQQDIIARIQKSGYDVALGEAVLPIKRLSDDQDAQRLEKALKQLPGVVTAQVSYATEKATVKYIPTVVTQNDLRQTISTAGFEAVMVAGNGEDGERLAREHEIAHQKHLLTVGLLFTVPLFFLAMTRDFGLLTPFFGGMPGMLMQMPGMPTTMGPHGSTGCCWCSLPPCSCMLGANIMWAHIRRCVMGRPTWMF
jgi:P-type Cu+ transporter